MLATIIIIFILTVAVIFAFRRIRKQKLHGKSCCGNCAGCGIKSDCCNPEKKEF